MAFVDPAQVGELRTRLHPAFASLASSPDGGEGAALASEGLAWCSGAPVSLFDAPGALERGKDLEARLRLLNRPQGQGTRVGTILGVPTVGEVEDLAAAQKYQLDAFNAMRGCPAWAAADPAGYGAWAADLYDATQKLQAALDGAHMSIAVIPDAIKNYTPDQPDWDNILAAAHPFADLMRRFMQAGYCAPPDMSGIPQPKNTDVDLKAFLWTDQATKKIEKAATVTWTDYGKPIVIGVVGLGVVLLIARASR